MRRDMSRVIGRGMRLFVKVRFEHAERQNIFLSDVVKEQVLEYALMTGSYTGTRALVKELSEAADAEELEYVLGKAKRGIEFLPDPSIGMVEMNDFGYQEDDVYPLRQEEAMYLHQEGNVIYCLHPDNTKLECKSEEMILSHCGIYGIETHSWERREYHKRTQEKEEWLQDMLASAPFVVFHEPEMVTEDEITAPVGFLLMQM